jgi:hypothetical protein
MRKASALLLLSALIITACNLDTPPQTSSSDSAAELTTPIDALTPDTSTGLINTPTTLPGIGLTPLGSGSVRATPSLAALPLPDINITPNTTSTGQLCQVYTTYSGLDPANKLSLRAQPSAAATQMLKMPNNAQVFLVPGSQEVEAEGYHWLNIIYVDPLGNRYQGWTARDSFSAQGVRDPSIATLRATGQQAPC